ncbi:hypothetical protein VNO77_18871 [Canavalia gladiata]|uniref:Uncharacterized protein n=1 Tax=Canavalia gladiata TaxID=3824 RepID=A0AAN9QK09_CANGL
MSVDYALIEASYLCPSYSQGKNLLYQGRGHREQRKILGIKKIQESKKQGASGRSVAGGEERFWFLTEFEKFRFSAASMLALAEMTCSKKPHELASGRLYKGQLSSAHVHNEKRPYNLVLKGVIGTKTSLEIYFSCIFVSHHSHMP